MSWLTGWTRRKPKIVENLTVSDYQMKLIVHKSGSGPDTSTDIYLGGNCRDDFADIRFTGPDQVTLLSYWIESITGTTPNLVATIWIKIPTLTPTNNIYIYYDNPTASPVSNGTNTFAFFDDFEDNNISDYVAESGSWSVSGGILSIGGGGEHYLRKSFTSFNADTSFIAEWYANTDRSYGAIKGTYMGFRIAYNNGYIETKFGNDISSKRSQLNRSNTQGEGGLLDSGAETDAWLNIKTIWDSQNNNSKIYWNENLHQSKNFTNVNSKPSGNSTYFYIYHGGWQAQTGRMGSIRVRKYTFPEPTFGVSGTEELGITATNMILNTNTCAGPCQIIAGVTWQNLGNLNITFTPAVLIDGTTIVYATSNITIGPYPAEGSSTITTPTLLEGTHQICPYPN